MRKSVLFLTAALFLATQLCYPAISIAEQKLEGPFKVVDKFYPTGWMGDYNDVRPDMRSKIKPYEGDTCQRWVYTGKASRGAGWAAVAWQYPENNWGNFEGYDLTAYKRVVFWARGEKGNEIIEARVGGHNNTLHKTYGPFKLTTTWKKHVIKLSGQDLSNVITGFVWSVAKDQNPAGCVFYLDNIMYE